MPLIPINIYVMKARINSPPYTKVTWKVYDTPDMTGALSGYPVGSLIDIVIDYTIDNNIATENGATPVTTAPGGPAGGDLGGDYPNPDVLRIHGYAVSNIAPTNQYVLTWNSSTNQWEPGIQTSGPPSGAAGGDLSGTFPNPTVAKVNGTSVPATPTANQVLRATNGTTASWTTIDNNSIAAGAGIVYSKLTLTGGIVNADVNSSAAIAGSKITPNFGTQSLTAGTSVLGTSASVNSLTGSIRFSIKTISSADTIDNTTTDVLVYADTTSSAFSITLPAPTSGRLLVFKDKKQTFATNNLTIVRNGSEKIDGVSASLVCSTTNQELIFTSDGTDWYTNQFSTSPTGAAGGDLSGTYPNPTVAKVNGATVPAAGALTTGHLLKVSGSSALSYGYLVDANVDAAAAIAGTKISPAFGAQNISTSGSLTISSLGLGIVHSSSGGLFSSSLIVNADVDAAAAIAGTKISPNFGSQNITTTGTLTSAGATFNGNVSLSTTSNLNLFAGNLTVGGISFLSGGMFLKQRTITSNDTLLTSDSELYVDTSGGAINLQLPAPQVGAFFLIKDSKQTFATNNLTIVRNGSEKIDGVSASKVCNVNNQEIILTSDGTDWYTQGGSNIIWANDLATSTDSSQNVVSLTGTSNTVTVKCSNLTWGSTVATPTISQTTGAGAGATLLVKSQAGTSGGTLRLEAGAGSSTTGGGVQIIAATGATNGGGIDLVAGSGTGGTGGPINITGGTGGNQGDVTLTSGSKNIIISNLNGISVSTLGTGVVHSNGSGLLSSSTIVDADVSSSAAIAVSKLAAGTSAQVLLNNSTPTPTWTTVSGDATISNTGVVTVTDITGASGTVDISSAGNIITWAAATTAPGIAQTSTSGGSGADMTIAAQGATGASNNGGGLVLAGGTSGSATAGTVVLKTGGSTRLTAGATGVITIANLSTGIVHADSSGNLTSSLLVNADVDAAAAIAGTKISPNFGSQNILTTGTLTTGTFTIGSTTSANSIIGSNTFTTKTFSTTGTIDTTTKDTIIYADTSGAAFTLTLPAPTNGRFFFIKDKTQTFNTNNLTVARNGSEKIDGASASLTMSTQNQGTFIVSDGTDWYTSSGGGGGGSGVTTVGTFDSQASSADGLVISGVTIYAQSATASNPGMIKLAGDIGGTGSAPTVTDITGASGKVDISSAGNIITWAAATTAPGISQTSTSSADGADMTIAAQPATGAGNDGGNLLLNGGTSGSALPGYVKIGSATVYKTTTQTDNYTVTRSDHHIFCNFSTGKNVTLPAPVDGMTFEVWDIAGTAETNNITLVRNGSEKISGIAASRVLKTNWGHWTITTNGTDWFVG